MHSGRQQARTEVAVAIRVDTRTRPGCRSDSGRQRGATGLLFLALGHAAQADGYFPQTLGQCLAALLGHGIQHRAEG
jgi:hypothetical protein